MKRWRTILWVFGLLAVLVLPVRAQEETAAPPDTQMYYQEQAEASGANRLLDSLPKETQELLDELGIQDLDFYSLMDLSPRALFNMLFQMLRGSAQSPLQSILRVLGVMLLLAIVRSLAPESDTQGVISFAGNALLVVCIVAPLSNLITAAASAISLSADFMLLLIPVLAAVVTATGNPMLALSYQSLTFAAAQGVSQLAQGFVVPFTGLFLATGVASAMLPEFSLKNITETIKKTAYGVLGFVAALFSGMLSLKGVMANAADTLATSGIKLVMKTAVPVVGSALSEAYASIAGSLTLLKSSIGALGILAIALINLPVMLQLLLWVLCLKLAVTVAGMLELEAISDLLDTVASALTLLAVMMLFNAVLLIIANGIVLAIRVDQ